MTAAHHASGTDRLAEVARKIKADWLVNVQGDLPFIHAATITQAVVGRCGAIERLPMGTVARRSLTKRNGGIQTSSRFSPDRNNFAIYFSRAPIPFREKCTVDPRAKPYARASSGGFGAIVISDFMSTVAISCLSLPGSGPRRWSRSRVWNNCALLQNGYRIHVALVDEKSVEVDTPEDLKRAELYLKRQLN